MRFFVWIMQLNFIEWLRGLFRLFVEANPAMHISSAILVISFLPLFPPLSTGIKLDQHPLPDRADLGKYSLPLRKEIDHHRPQDKDTSRKIPCALGMLDLGEHLTKSQKSTDNCAETLLAFGHRLDLKHANQADLELIPGISSRLSAAIMENRKIILEEAKIMDTMHRHQALQLVKGIGAAISRRLDELINLDGGQSDARVLPGD